MADEALPHQTKNKHQGEDLESFQFRKNNFDLIRLIAALQVVFMHGYEHFGLEFSPVFIRIVSAFPGVPIFFITSGFLISASLERSSSISSYIKNRFLRIYPALWVCFAISLASVFLLHDPVFSTFEMFKWVVAQVSIGQFYNPDFMRDYGVGVLNGSLWTIPIELQFYIALPIIYVVLNKLRWNGLVLLLILVSLGLLNFLHATLLSPPQSILEKLIGVTVFPYLYMFMLGVVLQRNIRFVKQYLANKVVPALILYIALAAIAGAVGIEYGGNKINPISALALAFLVLAFAYSNVEQFGEVLRGNDISYGVYIYHMVFVNILVEAPVSTPVVNLVVMMSLTIVTALLSWKLIEKPALSLKSYSVRRDANTSELNATP